MPLSQRPEVGLDEEIRQVEARIEQRRAALIANVEEAKEQVRSTIARPQTLLIALALGFVASRVALRGLRRRPATMVPGSRGRRFLNTAITTALARFLPLAMGPLRGVARDWFARRFG